MARSSSRRWTCRRSAPAEAARLRRLTTLQRSAIEEQAWALKDQAQAAWHSDPPQTRAAARTLAELAGTASRSTDPGPQPAAAGLHTLRPLAVWAEGLALLAEGELPSALSCLREAARQWQALQLSLHAAQVQVAEVVALSMMGRFDEAVACGRAAETVLAAQGDQLAAAKLAINLGSLEMQRDCYGQAASQYRRAGVLAARVGARQQSILADIGRADALTYAGKHTEARLIYDRAEMRANTHGLAAQAASAEHGRALLSLDEGRYREGLAGLARARQAFERCGIEHDRVEVEKNLADGYLLLRLLPEALALYELLLPRLRAQSGEATLPWLLTQMASAQALAGRPELAHPHLQEAASHFQGRGNTLGLAWVRLLDAEILRDQGAHAHAEVAARALAATPGLPANIGQRLQLLLAACERLLGRPAPALARLDALLAETATGSAPLLRAHGWHERGLALRALGQSAESAQAFEHAIAEFEDVRAALPGDDLQQAVLGDHLGPYVERLQHALAHEPDAAVLQWLERHRARVLSERLQQGRLAGDGGMEGGVCTGGEPGDSALRMRLRWLQQQRQRRLQEGEAGLAAPLQTETERIERHLLESARRQRLLQAGQAVPGSAAWAAGGELAPTLDLARLCAAFQGGRALLAYGAAGDELFAVVVAAGRVRLHRRLASWAEVNARLRQMRFQIDTWRCGSPALQAHLPQLLVRTEAHLHRLYKDLIAPLEPSLAQAREWVLVPHDGLHALPFAALHDGQGWLNERVQLRMAVSAVVAALDPRPALAAGTPGLVVGDSHSLAHVATEVQAVNAALPKAPCLLGPAARVAVVAQQATTADVLHLACHGEFRADNALFSALHLSDGPWTALQIAERPLPARLVVMSACDTGLADRLPGDESVGLVRAFLLAGAHEVLASLWAVDDAATADFMGFFYAAWRQTGDTAAALQTARRQARALRPHPFHWAAFVLHGTPASRGA